MSDRPLLASTLSAAALDELRTRIRARPGQWVGQEIIEPSTAPTVTGAGSIEPRPMVLRTFAVSDDRNNSQASHGYSVMPGGLTRVGADPTAADDLEPTQGQQQGHLGGVDGAGPAAERLAAVRPRPGQSPMAPDVATPLPGRVAAQLFVLGRTAEHAELVIRLIRTVLARLDQPLGLGVDGGAESLQVLLSALGAVSGFDPVSEPDERGLRGLGGRSRPVGQ